MTSPRRHQRAKKNTCSTPPTAKHHHTQFFHTPPSRTQPVTTSGVSALKLVATIDVPASHHPIVRPLRKYSSTLWLALRVYRSPIHSEYAMKTRISPQSIQLSRMGRRA